MSFELKPIHREAIPEALAKAERYRLLNEPSEAESICLDILQIDPDNQEALISLILALTDQFGAGVSVEEPRKLLPRLKGGYERAYYAGIIWERLARHQVRQSLPGIRHSAWNSLRQALKHFEEAEKLRPPHNDDAVLRWNSCVRMLHRHPDIKETEVERPEPILSE
jgi:tetratricopeptide (TPR) repeat protein